MARAVPDQPETTANWQGDIEHVQTGRRWAFGTLDEVPEFLQRQADDPEELGWPAEDE